ncbi:MAG: hypothetical protein II458_05435 [Oscillospiraceae bacterium]|nr:hypothetical protein [Oscillospiraceae bacterium]
MRTIRCAAVLALACLMLLSVIACKALPNKSEQFSILVQGNLDEIYLGRANSSYLKLTGSTAEDVAANYEGSLGQEATFFCGYFSIAHPTDQIRSEIVELYRQIYANASYIVGDAVKADDGSYAVSVEIQPLNIMQTAIDGHEESLAGFYEKYRDVDSETLSGAELAAYEADWAHAVIGMVRAQLSHITYRDAVTVDVRVSQTEGGFWQMNAEDLQAVDALILYYPTN